MADLPACGTDRVKHPVDPATGTTFSGGQPLHLIYPYPFVHMHDVVVQHIPEGVAKGQVAADESVEKAMAASLKTKQDVVKFVNERWSAGDGAAAATADQHLAAMVPTPWGKAFPGFVLCEVVNHEHLHHRGQLYTYARTLGIEPPMIWDFSNSAEAYRPKRVMTG